MSDLENNRPSEPETPKEDEAPTKTEQASTDTNDDEQAGSDSAKPTPESKDQKDEEEKTAKPQSEVTATVPLQNNFYRDQYNKLFITLVASIIAAIGCLAVIIYILLHSPDPVLFSSDYHDDKNLPPAISNYSIVPITPIDKANMSDSEITQWLVNALTASFAIDSQNYNANLAKVKMYYSDNAWSQYLTILNNMVQFNTFKTNQSVVSVLTPLGAPIIDNQGLSQGRYLWVFKIPVKVNFFGSIVVPAQTMTLVVIVGRTPMKNDVYGIKIGSIQATDIERIRMTAQNATTAPGRR